MVGYPFTMQHGDSLEVMREFGEQSIDHVITDPPYSEHVHGNHRSMRRDGAGENAARAERELGFDSITHETMLRAAEQFARIARRWVLVFTDVESVHLWRDALTFVGLEYVRTGIWRKTGAAPQFSGDRPGVGYEAIVIAHPSGRKRWNGGGKHAFWQHSIALNRSGSEPRYHPTEKPVDLMRELVLDFTDEGDSILDPFAGSGSTGVAALLEGRHFSGVEIDESHYVTARKRLLEASSQPRLLNGAR